MTTEEWKQVFQGLGILGGALSTVFGLFAWRMKNEGAKDLKKLDMSVEWQNQMLGRIAAVEAELSRERSRGDLLESEAFKWRAQASELAWELQRSRASHDDFQKRLAEVIAHNADLQRQNEALARELREMHRSLSGYPVKTIPPRG